MTKWLAKTGMFYLVGQTLWKVSGLHLWATVHIIFCSGHLLFDISATDYLTLSCSTHKGLLHNSDPSTFLDLSNHFPPSHIHMQTHIPTCHFLLLAVHCLPDDSVDNLLCALCTSLLHKPWQACVCVCAHVYMCVWETESRMCKRPDDLSPRLFRGLSLFLSLFSSFSLTHTLAYTL